MSLSKFMSAFKAGGTFKLGALVLPVKAVTLLAVVLVGGTGYAALGYNASTKAEKTVKAYLIKTDMLTNVRYSDISGSVFSDEITLHDVELRMPQGGSEPDVPVRADFVQLNELKIQDGILTNFDIRINGFTFSAREVSGVKHPFINAGLRSMTTLKSFSHNPLLSLVILGYDEVRFDLTARMHFDIEAGTLSVSYGLDGHDIASAELESKLTDLPTALIKQFMAVVSGQTRLDQVRLPSLEQMINDYAKISLAEVKLTIRDNGYLLRARDYLVSYAAPRKGEKVENLFISDEKERLEWVAGLEKNGLSRKAAENIIYNLTDFTADPDRLIISTNMDTPIPLAQMNFFAPDVKSRAKLLLLTGLVVKN